MVIEIKKTIKPIEIAEEIGDEVLDNFFSSLQDFLTGNYGIEYSEVLNIIDHLPDEEIAEILQIIVDGFKAEANLI